MKIITLLTFLLTLFITTTASAKPPDPLVCFCHFEDVLLGVVDGEMIVDVTDCQIPGTISHSMERGNQGTFTETLTFVGGKDQACATLQISKSREGNETQRGCIIHIDRSTSDDEPDCETIMAGDSDVEHMDISHKNVTACGHLLDEIADQVFALPGCPAP